MPGGVDRVLKQYVDSFRKGGLPPELHGQVRDAMLWGDQAEIRKLRAWNSDSALKGTYRGVGVVGGLDDLLIQSPRDGETHARYSPLDVKTKGDEPKDAGLLYYQTQMDHYAWLLRENGMWPSGRAYLWYWWPTAHASQGPSGGLLVGFAQRVFEVAVDPDRTEKLMDEALAILNEPSQIRHVIGCEWGEYIAQRNGPSAAGMLAS